MKILWTFGVIFALLAWSAPPVHAEDIFDPGEGYYDDGEAGNDGSESGASANGDATGNNGTDKNKDGDSTDNDNGIGNSRVPPGSVPYITSDEASVAYLVDAIVTSLAESLSLSGGDAEEVAQSAESNYYKYARSLSETLSQLSPAEQNTIWYGY